MKPPLDPSSGGFVCFGFGNLSGHGKRRAVREMPRTARLFEGLERLI